jgi:hypothetical protein
VPLDRCLIETDSPYLAPVPYRGKVNSPAYVPWVARQLAEVKKLEWKRWQPRRAGISSALLAHEDMRNNFTIALNTVIKEKTTIDDIDGALDLTAVSESR